MKVISDLHIHGRFSRATSKQLNIANLEKYARLKGVNLLGTGDFTHPKWIKELKRDLKEEDGVLKTSTGFPFLLQTEVSLIYSQAGKGHRVHIVLLAPDFDTVDQITEAFLKRGRIDYDGRPIFKIPCPELVEMMHSINNKIEIIPAHAWTPWFGMYGSMSGFDSLKECFLDKAGKINAIETGLSSDPEMNWRIKELDNKSILSFSDAHSFWPWRIGREATVFDLKKINYESILKSIRNKENILQTIEFFPEQGKYHYDGHRNCGIVMNPKQSLKCKGICPKCGRAMTLGVAYRVEKLADREEGYKPKNAVDFKKLIPLSEIISGSLGVGVATKKVWEIFYELQKAFGNELNVLLNASFEDLCKVVDSKLAGFIIANREQKIEFNPGYDGVYGEPIFGEKIKKQEIKITKKQKSLGDF